MMSTPRTLYLERPAFWTEARDPEVWFRAIEAVAAASVTTSQTGTPRTVAERCLVGTVAWRGAIGLFGAFRVAEDLVLPGVGLFAQGEGGDWLVTDEAHALVRTWRKDPSLGLERLAAHLLRESPWLRLLMLHLLPQDWRIDWTKARSSRAGLKAGATVFFDRLSDPSEWFSADPTTAAGRWLARTGCHQLAIAPGVFGRKRGKDDLSLSPLTAPLHLLETVGWLGPDGSLRLPASAQEDLLGEMSAANALTDITARRADVRGLVAAEPTLRELLATFSVRPSDDVFPVWMDQLVESATSTGALEVLTAEPGQARHGRGLFGDPTRKLVRWVVHEDFNDHFRNVWAALEREHTTRAKSPDARDEELTP